MTIEHVVTVPTAEECEIYFNNLPAIEYFDRKAAPVAIAMGDDAGLNIDIGNLAETGKESPAVIAFADGVSAVNREAVMLSVAFAESVASGKGDINADPIKWLSDYSEALRYSGWTLTGGNDYSEYSTSDASLTMDSVVLELISAVAGPNAATVISLLSIVLDKLQQNEPLMKLFETNSKKGSVANFRIMPCLESSAGIPVTYVLAMQCEYSSESGGALFWKWSVSSLHIKRLVKGVEFSRSLHDTYKDRIVKHLKGNADDFFDGLK